MRFKVMLVGIFCWLSGCATQQFIWVKSDQNQMDYSRDLAQCEYEGKLATASYSSGPTARGANNAAIQGMFEGLEISGRRQDLMLSCMKARGYQQVFLDRR